MIKKLSIEILTGGLDYVHAMKINELIDHLNQGELTASPMDELTDGKVISTIKLKVRVLEDALLQVERSDLKEFFKGKHKAYLDCLEMLSNPDPGKQNEV